MYISFFKKDLENKGFPVLVRFQIKGLVFWHPTTWRNAQKIWSFFLNKVNPEKWHSTLIIQFNLSVDK